MISNEIGRGRKGSSERGGRSGGRGLRGKSYKPAPGASAGTWRTAEFYRRQHGLGASQKWARGVGRQKAGTGRRVRWEQGSEGTLAGFAQAAGVRPGERVPGQEKPLYLGRSSRRRTVVLASNWTIVDMLMRRLDCW